MHILARQLINWYEVNHRSLPWRSTRDPYKIWLSEIILQQTRIDQGLPYYNRFLEVYPDLPSLARADLQDVLRLWQGLGYYSRARNMHRCALMIVKEYKGRFPADYHSLIKLPGIGKYTAAAIASFAFGQNTPAIDGNVLRVISRLFGIHKDVYSAATQNMIKDIVQGIMPSKQPDLLNQSLMEFGALQCVPVSPRCTQCPLQTACDALKSGTVGELPVRNKKIKKKDRYFTYFVIEVDRRLILKQRQQRDIWEGLYDFYLVEDSRHITLEQTKDDIINTLLIENAVIEAESGVFKHVLTHQVIYAVFYHIRTSSACIRQNLLEKGYNSYSLDEIERLPKPRLIQGYLESFHGL